MKSKDTKKPKDESSQIADDTAIKFYKTHGYWPESLEADVIYLTHETAAQTLYARDYGQSFH